jgi:hypothetical protein
VRDYDELRWGVSATLRRLDILLVLVVVLVLLNRLDRGRRKDPIHDYEDDDEGANEERGAC